MKKLYIIIIPIFLLLFSNALFAQTWVLVNTVSNPGIGPSISVADMNTVWIADGSPNTPKIFRSVNGGVNFTQISVTGISQEIYCIWGTSSTNAFVGEGEVNGNARLFRTTNGGLNWISVVQTSANGGFFNGLAFTKATASVFGLAIAEKVFRTSNNGTTWIELNSGVNGVSNAHNSLMIIDNNFYGFGLNNGSARIRLTTDNANSWSNQQVNISGNNTSAIAFHSNKLLGVAATSTSLPVIARTIDGGLTWTNVNIGAGPTGNCSINWIPNTPVVYLMGANGIIKRSTNNGLTWITTPTSVVNLTHFDFVHAGNIIYGYAVSSNGSVIKLVDTLSVLTSNNNHNSETPKEFSLSQNYPNPFNPSTVIGFKLAVNSFASLKVYDLLGREVATLVNENLKAGTYEFDFDGNKLSSGVYYYKLTTGSFVETKKMILIK